MRKDKDLTQGTVGAEIFFIFWFSESIRLAARALALLM